MERKSLILVVSCRPGVTQDMILEGLAREGNLPYWLLGTSFAAILAILGVCCHIGYMGSPGCCLAAILVSRVDLWVIRGTRISIF